MRQLEQQDANLRRALRSAGPRATERINVEIETVATELSEATARLNELQVRERPLRITKKLVDQTIDEMTGNLGAGTAGHQGRLGAGPLRAGRR